MRNFIIRKRFFFEKKKQKTFCPAGCGEGRANAPRSKSFFASFFSKKEALSWHHFQLPGFST
jgi:hypothetical protein